MPRLLPPPRFLPFLTLALLSASAFAAMPHARTSRSAAPPTPAPARSNPLLPPQLPLENFFIDLSLTQQSPATAPTGFDPLYTPEDWQAYRDKFGNDADQLARKKSSALIEFSQKLIDAANDTAANPEGKDYRRLLLLRAAIDCYRNRGGFDTANKAVLAYQNIMNIHSPTQVAALWTIANAMSRTITTPRPDRIHYSAIAARANMQLTILLLDNDQLDAAESLQKLVGYHEGWLHTAGASPADRIAYGQIAQVRALVKQTSATLDYLATQYQPAIDGDDNALMAIYLYGRYVKQKPEIVADLPGRKPASPLAQLAATLSAVDRKMDPTAPYTAAETLKIVASTLPDGVLKQRTLYAALQNYRAFIADPRTERDRVKRTLARMAIESVISDGAHGPAPVVNPFAPPPSPPAPPTTLPAPNATQPATEPRAPILSPATPETSPTPTTPTTRRAPITVTRPAPTSIAPSSPSMPEPQR